MIPDQVEYFITPIDDSKYYKTRFDFWNNVYGFKMTDMREQHINEPVFDKVNQGQMLADECCFKKIDLKTVKAEELTFVTRYKVKIDCGGEMNALALWFCVKFSRSHTTIRLDGAPYTEKRTFSQLILYLKNKTRVSEGDMVWGSIAWRNSTEEKLKTDLKLSANIDKCKYRNVQYYMLE